MRGLLDGSGSPRFSRSRGRLREAPNRPGVALLLALAIAIAIAGSAGASAADATGGPNRLESVHAPRSADSADFVLKFTRKPEFVRVPLENSLVLVLDFVGTVFEPIRESLVLKSGPVRMLSVTQFARDRVRMSMKLASRGKVEIFRHHADGLWALTMRIVPVQTRPKLDGPAERGRRAVVVFDPGHGGRDEGARGRWLREKDMALAVALEAVAACQGDPRIQARLTRSDDTYVPLEDRTAFAERCHAAAFVSIHANSTRERVSPAGVEIYFLSLKGATDEQSRLLAERENSAGGEAAHGPSVVDEILVDMQQTNTINLSSKLAAITMRRWIRPTGQKNRGIRQAGFRVLKSINVPSILVECGFISHPREERLLGDRDYQRLAGKVLYQAVVEYLKHSGQL